MAGRNDAIIEEFRSNAGKVGGYFDGASMLLLHSIGRRTREERVNPLVYLPDDDRWVVFGTKGGAPADPDWVRNLEANPDATIEVGIETIPVRVAAILREGPEHDELYERQIARRSGFAGYLEKTSGIRAIPVIVLERRGR